MRTRALLDVAAVTLALAVAGCSHVGQDRTAASAPDPGTVSASGSFDPERDCSSGDATEDQIASYCNGNGAGRIHAVGDAVPWADDQGNSGTVTLHQVFRAGVDANAGYPVDPPKHGSWVVAEVTIAVDQGQMPVGEYGSFQASDPAGGYYQSSCAGVDEQGKDRLPDVTLTAGRKATGVVCFDAPAGALFLDFLSTFMTVPVATFQFTS